MLIITREPGHTDETGHTFYVNDNIVIRVLGVRGNQVRLGIDAPKHIDIIRDDAIKKKGA